MRVHLRTQSFHFGFGNLRIKFCFFLFFYGIFSSFIKNKTEQLQQH